MARCNELDAKRKPLRAEQAGQRDAGRMKQRPQPVEDGIDGDVGAAWRLAWRARR